MAVDSSGDGSTNNNSGASPIVAEIINASQSQLNQLTNLPTGSRAKMRGIFRFWISPTLSSARYSTNGLFQFNISGTSGFSYIAQASTNLVDWVCLRTNVSPFTFTDASADMLPNRFYRGVYLP
jgi:hypothetical protein